MPEPRIEQRFGTKLRTRLHWLPLASHVATWWLLAVVYGITGWTLADHVHDGWTLSVVSFLTASGSLFYGMGKEFTR